MQINKVKKLRIVIGSLARGGTETHLLRTLPELSNLGWSIKIITLMTQQPNDYTANLRENGIEILTYPTTLSFNFFPNLMRRVCRFFVNIIRLTWDFTISRNAVTNLYLPAAYFYGSISATLSFTKSPLIMSRRSLNYYQKNKTMLFRILERYFHKKMDYIFVNSQAVLEQLVNEEAVSYNKLRLIYNGIQTKIEGKSTFQKSTQFNLVMIANLIPYKGHVDLIHALHIFNKKTNAPWKMLLAGGGEKKYQFYLEEMVHQYGLQENIIFMGMVEQNKIESVLLNADVGVLCSHEEGFSNAILEYMKFSLPVIATNVGGNPEAVINGVSGIIVPPHNTLQLSEAIYRLSKNKEKGIKMGAKGRERVKNDFNIDKCIDKYHLIYTTLSEGSL